MKRNIGEVALEYLAKFPDAPTLTIAKRMAKDHPELFKDAEGARDRLRYYRGNSGAKDRKSAGNTSPETFRKSRKAGWKHPIPPSRSDNWGPAVLDHRKTLILGDIHLPFHDVKAVEAALRFGKAYRPDLILFNGDLHDCYALSKFIKNPLLRNFPEELETLEDFFKYLRERFKCDVVMKLGNHEERAERYLYTRAPDLVGTTNWEYEKLINAENYGIEIVKDQRIILLGELPVIHGHEFVRSFSNPVNPARGLFLRGIHTALTSHWHQTSDHVERDMMGKIVTTWSTGCLCDLHPEYSRLNKWNHGFATVEVSKNYNFSVENYRIYNGKIL